MIIHRAYIREVLQSCAAVAGILFSIFFVVRLVKFLSAAAQGDIPMNSVLLLLLLKMLTYFDIIIPLVIYISIMLVMGRWIRDNELTVISACGIGIAQLLKPNIMLFLILGFFVGIFSLYLAPLSAKVAHSLEHEYRNRSVVTGIIPGVFTETRGGSGVYFVESHHLKSDTYRDIFFDNVGAEDDGVVAATTGYIGRGPVQDGKAHVDFGDDSRQNENAHENAHEKAGALADTDKQAAESRAPETTHDKVPLQTQNEQSDRYNFLILKNGSQYTGEAGDKHYTLTRFETYAIRLKQRSARASPLRLRATSTFALLDLPIPRSIAEFHWRFSKIAMLPILILFALSFSATSYRKARFPGMIVALLVYFTYTNVLGFGVAMIRRETLPPHLTLWIIHLVFLIFAMYLFSRRMRNLRFIPELSALKPSGAPVVPRKPQYQNNT